jgi:NAD(P)-dependent dehydrogenase (short-subunit alcohol dehydrogenase family)
MPLTLVTGGSRGIGAAICLRLARDGHDLVVAYRSDADAANALAEQVRARGRAAQVLQVETSSEQSVSEMFAAVDGTLTGLVNNAGISGGVARLVDADAEAMRRAIEVNVLGYLLCARGALRAFQGSGSIVNISSGAATLGGANRYVHYAATKAAVDAMTVGLAKEVAVDGVRVNAVSPGTIYTDFHAEPDRADQVGPTVPLGRAGQPEEIAAAVAWLLSDDASYTTGANIRVAGGL